MPDACDACPGSDDGDDYDGDGTPDDCDPCPIDALDDSDGDGICDSDELDSDLDGDLDLVIANGHVLDNIELYDPHQTFAQPAQLFENLGRGKFRNLREQVGYKLTELLKVPAAPPEAIQKETAETLLRKLVEQNDPQYRAASYILAVMLERKRLLKVKAQSNEGGVRVFIYEQPKTGDVFTITDPNLQLNQLEAVQRDVAHLLEHVARPGLPIDERRQAIGNPDVLEDTPHDRDHLVEQYIAALVTDIERRALPAASSIFVIIALTVPFPCVVWSPTTTARP